MESSKQYEMSIARLAPVAARPLRRQDVGLKAQWETIRWAILQYLAQSLSTLGAAIAGLSDGAGRPESFEKPADDLVEYGYDVIVVGSSPWDPNVVTRMLAACHSFTESVFQELPVVNCKEYANVLTENDIRLVDDARERFLSVSGGKKIAVAFSVNIGAHYLNSPGHYPRKPPKPDNPAEVLNIEAKFEGVIRETTIDKRTNKLVIKAKCIITQLGSAGDIEVDFAPNTLLYDVHSRTFDEIYYSIEILREFGFDGKASYYLLHIGEVSPLSNARLVP